jgi:hypothetical protein
LRYLSRPSKVEHHGDAFLAARNEEILLRAELQGLDAHSDIWLDLVGGLQGTVIVVEDVDATLRITYKEPTMLFMLDHARQLVRELFLLENVVWVGQVRSDETFVFRN